MPVTAKSSEQASKRRKSAPNLRSGGTSETGHHVEKLNTQQRISRFHTLIKQLDHLKEEQRTLRNKLTGSPDDKARARKKIKVESDESFAHGLGGAIEQQIKDIEREIEGLGGLDAYQKASLKGGNEKLGKGACGRFLGHYLRSLHKERNRKLRLLDIGALSIETYARHSSFVKVHAIDLNPQCAGVLRQDFFERPLPGSEEETFDVLCLSLVVNFVPNATRRGLMLQRAKLFLKPGGLLYIVLPLPCITNSRYLTHDHFLDIFAWLDLDLVTYHHSKKLASYVFKARGGVEPKPGSTKEGDKQTPFPKRLINDGPGRNNFVIVLEGGPESVLSQQNDKPKLKTS
ncbi:putative methyltransferase-domain-containing protein [Cladochytrium replicatum]|nr:putative methyltransferase-domain-containing protein [Cladochytrium replicatum]